MLSLIRVSRSGQEATEESMMGRISEAAGGMPLLPGAAAAQVGTIRLLQHSRIVAQSIERNHQYIVGADNGIHISHRDRFLPESCFISHS